MNIFSFEDHFTDKKGCKSHFINKENVVNKRYQSKNIYRLINKLNKQHKLYKLVTYLPNVTKIQVKIFLYIVLLIFTLSCNNNDDSMFNQTPIDRAKINKTELQNTLLSSVDGYKVNYFPNKKIYGGFTFLMKFKNDYTVEMTSNLTIATEITNSKYEITDGDNTELIFTISNHIHQLSNTDIIGLKGIGYGGATSFQYLNNIDGKIMFMDPRNESIFELELAKQTDWEQIKTAANMRLNMHPPTKTPPFQQLIINDSKGEMLYNLNYDAIRYFAKPKHQNDDNTGESSIPFGFHFTTDGFIATPPIKINESTYQTFVYNPAQLSFVASDGSATATIKFTDNKAFATDDVLKIGKTLNRFEYNPNLDTDYLTSSDFKDNLINELNTNLFPEKFKYFKLTTKPNKDKKIQLWVEIIDPENNNKQWSAGYLFNSKIENNKIYFEYVDFYDGEGEGEYYEKKLKPLLDFFATPNGFIYEDKDIFYFHGTTNGSTNTGILTNVQNPLQRVFGLWFNE